MGRRKNQDYWNQVTKVTVEENGKVKEKVKCKRCGDVFAGGVSRIRPHVDQIPGKGISVCTVDPVDEGVHNNVASGSSIPQEAMNVANSLQVEDAYQPIDSSIGGSINHQDNVESNYLVEVAPELIGTNIGGSINHQSNVEFNYFVKGAPGMISTNIGGPVNHQDTVEYGALANPYHASNCITPCFWRRVMTNSPVLATVTLTSSIISIPKLILAL